MTTVEEAKRLMMAHVPLMPAKACSLVDAGGRYTVEDVMAPHDHPLFHMSAVDGYAFAFSGEAKEWTVAGSVAAGEVFGRSLRPGECVRVFTGAMLPEGADTVVMQEYAERQGPVMSHADVALRPGANVRYKAEQVRSGAVMIEQGSRLNATAIGLLASVGVRSVAVHRSPRIGLVLTGGEFIEGDRPQPGRIFNSNGVMLGAALHAEGLEATEVRVQDDRSALDEALLAAIRTHDVVVSTGGASVGDHDLVHEAVLRAGGTIHFHGVAQKPGKPMLFATINGRPFFGLPGNPRAAMVLYWEYVLPFLRAMRGARRPWPVTSMLPVSEAFTLKGDRAEFRAGVLDDGHVRLLADEGSHMLRSLTNADVIVHLSADRRSWQVGDRVEVHHIPHEGSSGPR